MSTSSNRARVLVDGHRVLPVLLGDLAAAEQTIHLSVASFAADPMGERIARLLEQKARAGVTVRLLSHLPRAGALDPTPLALRMAQAGVRVVDTNIDYGRTPSVTDPRLKGVFTQIREAIDPNEPHFDHRKMVVVDGRIAWTGSMNIGAPYLFDEPFDRAPDADGEVAAGAPHASARWPKWHDALTRFEGPIASAFEEAFRTRWILDGGEEYEPADAVARAPEPEAGMIIKGARVYASELDGRPNPIRALYLDRIRHAERSIFIENPQLHHPEIVDALCDAKERRPELDVVLIVPAREHNESAFSQDAQQHAYDRYLACGVEVREYQERFTHLTMAVFDERWSIHGSARLSYRSLEDDKDFDLVVLVDDEPLARTILEEIRDVDRGRSREVTREDIEGAELTALRARMSDPRTVLLLSQHLLEGVSDAGTCP